MHRRWQSLLVVFSLVVACVITRTAHATNEGFVTRVGEEFMLDGKPFRFAGANAYYLMTYATGPDHSRASVDEDIRDAAAMQLKVLRTWAFNDSITGADSCTGLTNWHPLQVYPRVYRDSSLAGLDYTLAKCDEYGIRVILVLTNNWYDYGGMTQYLRWRFCANAQRAAAPSDTCCDGFYKDQFYTDDSCRVWYKANAEMLINRVNTFNGRKYGEDPTIFAWELANEPTSPTDTTGSVMAMWGDEMSRFVKSLDRNHMVSFGGQGFYPDEPSGDCFGSRDGVDFLLHNGLPAIDFATSHLYPDPWCLSLDPSIHLLTRQINDARYVLGKPFVLEEFGLYRDSCCVLGAPNHYDPRTYFGPGVPWHRVAGAEPIGSKPFGLHELWRTATGRAACGTTTARRDTFFAAFFDILLNNDVGGSCFWVLYHRTYLDYDCYGVYYPEDSTTVALITAHALTMMTDASPLNDVDATVNRSWEMQSVQPNPVKSSVTVAFAGPARQTATFRIFDVNGRSLRTLSVQPDAHGRGEIRWDLRNAEGKRVPAGMYLARLDRPSFRSTRKLVVLP